MARADPDRLGRPGPQWGVWGLPSYFWLSNGNEVLLSVIWGHTLALAPSIEAAYDFIMQALRAQECWQGSERSCCPKFIHVCWSLRFAPCRLCAARSAFRLNMLHAAPLVPSGWRFFGSSNTSNA